MRPPPLPGQRPSSSIQRGTTRLCSFVSSRFLSSLGRSRFAVSPGAYAPLEEFLVVLHADVSHELRAGLHAREDPLTPLGYLPTRCFTSALYENVLVLIHSFYKEALQPAPSAPPTAKHRFLG